LNDFFALLLIYSFAFLLMIFYTSFELILSHFFDLFCTSFELFFRTYFDLFLRTSFDDSLTLLLNLFFRTSLIYFALPLNHYFTLLLISLVDMGVDCW